MLDAILPLRERGARTRARAIGDVPLSCRMHELCDARVTTLLDYREETARDLIRSLKYDGSRHAARLAAAVVEDYLREEIASAKAFGARRILLVPVPLHSRRKRERGFNQIQIELVLRNLPREFRFGPLSALETNALRRLRETKPQTGLPRDERLLNVAGAFAAPHPELVEKSRVFLFDDVATTGATLANASLPLEEAGAEVTPLALARA